MKAMGSRKKEAYRKKKKLTSKKCERPNEIVQWCYYSYSSTIGTPAGSCMRERRGKWPWYIGRSDTSKYLPSSLSFSHTASLRRERCSPLTAQDSIKNVCACNMTPVQPLFVHWRQHDEGKKEPNTVRCPEKKKREGARQGPHRKDGAKGQHEKNRKLPAPIPVMFINYLTLPSL